MFVVRCGSRVDSLIESEEQEKGGGTAQVQQPAFLSFWPQLMWLPYSLIGSSEQPPLKTAPCNNIIMTTHLPGGIPGRESTVLVSHQLALSPSPKTRVRTPGRGRAAAWPAAGPGALGWAGA